MLAGLMKTIGGAVGGIFKGGLGGILKGGLGGLVKNVGGNIMRGIGSSGMVGRGVNFLMDKVLGNRFDPKTSGYLRSLASNGANVLFEKLGANVGGIYGSGGDARLSELPQQPLVPTNLSPSLAYVDLPN
jgi:hypothetical protein